VEGSTSPTLTLDRPPASPAHAGAGGGFKDATQSPCRAPRQLASPTNGVAGQPAGQATRQLLHLTPRPPTSPGSLTWANVARGTVRAGESTCPRHQPAVTASDFTALYDRCLASGLKARVTFNYAAGTQVLTVSCNLPAPAASSTAAGKHRRRRCRRRRRGRTVTAAVEDQVQSSPPIAVVSGVSTLPAHSLPPPVQPPLPSPGLPSPELQSPPAKRTRRR
jgi:hypothetical protein